jgi:hypothetical protein
MPPESPGSMGLDAPKLPDDDRASGEPPDEPDPDWPDDWPDDDQGDAARTAPAPDGRGGGGGGPPRRRLLALAAVAAVALAAGAGIALAVGRSHAPAPGTAASRPPLAAPGGNGSGGALPGGGGGGTIQMLVGGRVLAVSGTSITIGGPDHTVTAAVTSSTRITGRVSSIRSVRAGDMVTAQIEQSGGRAVVTAIQDPAQLPPGASSP